MRRFQFVGIATAAGLLGMIFSGVTQDVENKKVCDWEMLDETVVDPPLDKDQKRVVDIGGSGAFSQGLALVNARPEKVHGVGHAHDLLVGPDILVNAKATALRRQTWRDNSSTEGRATVKSAVGDIKGEARLKDADSAAMATGYHEFTTNIGVELLVKLDGAAGETVAEKLGDLKLEYKDLGLTIEIPITVSKGTGRYPDQEANSTAGEKCTDFFTFQNRSAGHIRCFADGGLFTSPFSGASCTADLNGKMKSKMVLDCCPPKPGS